MRKGLSLMKRLVSVVSVVAIVLTLLVAASTGTPSKAQTGDQATIEAQETRIAELEGTVDARGERMNAQRTEISALEAELAGEPAPTEGAAEPEPGDVDTTLFGVPPDSLPQGADGDVSIIAMGAPVRNDLPVVLRNNTGSEVFLTGMQGVVRDAGGSLLASVGLSTLAPYQLLPEQVAVGYVYFDGVDEIPADVQYELEPEYETVEGDFSFHVDMVITEAELIDDGIVGIASNPLEDEMSGGSAVGICFDADGAVVGYLSGSTDKYDIPAGDDSAFGARFQYPGESFDDGVTAANSCVAYLVGVVGIYF